MRTKIWKKNPRKNLYDGLGFKTIENRVSVPKSSKGWLLIQVNTVSLATSQQFDIVQLLSEIKFESSRNLQVLICAWPWSCLTCMTCHSLCDDIIPVFLNSRIFRAPLIYRRPHKAISFLYYYPLYLFIYIYTLIYQQDIKPETLLFFFERIESL